MDLFKLGIPLPAPLWTDRQYWKHYLLSNDVCLAVKIARLLKKLWDFSQFFLANRSRSHADIFRMNLPFERTNSARSHIASLLRYINRFMVCLDYPTPQTIQKWVVYGGVYTAHRDINTDSHWVLRQFIRICVYLGLCACLTPLASSELSLLPSCPLIVLRRCSTRDEPKYTLGVIIRKPNMTIAGMYGPKCSCGKG